jgi:hypothetical protein
MKRIEIFLLAVTICALLSPAGTLLAITGIRDGFNAKEFAGMTSAVTYLGLVGRNGVALACGVWLFVEAGRHGLTRWIWCVFGLMFNLKALILYYVYRIYQTRVDESDQSGEQTPGARSGEMNDDLTGSAQE